MTREPYWPLAWAGAVLIVVVAFAVAAFTDQGNAGAFRVWFGGLWMTAAFWWCSARWDR